MVVLQGGGGGGPTTQVLYFEWQYTLYYSMDIHMTSVSGLNAGKPTSALYYKYSLVYFTNQCVFNNATTDLIN